MVTNIGRIQWFLLQILNAGSILNLLLRDMIFYFRENILAFLNLFFSQNFNAFIISRFLCNTKSEIERIEVSLFLFCRFPYLSQGFKYRITDVRITSFGYSPLFALFGEHNVYLKRGTFAVQSFQLNKINSRLLVLE